MALSALTAFTETLEDLRLPLLPLQAYALANAVLKDEVIGKASTQLSLIRAELVKLRRRVSAIHDFNH